MINFPPHFSFKHSPKSKRQRPNSQEGDKSEQPVKVMRSIEQGKMHMFYPVFPLVFTRFILFFRLFSHILSSLFASFYRYCIFCFPLVFHKVYPPFIRFIGFILCFFVLLVVSFSFRFSCLFSHIILGWHP
jgi:hypothetical protein